ncbi:MAG: bile acid:sodium symporter family protein [Gammaproteobacteria bacterium]|nr:bile acid:sodium symporter family protein [Gammaproteobacteria bacterium]TVQ47777.1 MAG: bile acid:sodium symporter family protein [Gammaproteobacteria bacterium]
MDTATINQVLLPLGLGLILFAMGLTLTLADFRRVIEAPWAVGVGLAGQIVLMPLLGLAFLFAWPQAPVIAVGFMLLLACPGGPTSNFLTHLARGDTALSVTLTAISSLLGALTVPVVVNLGIVLVGDGSTRELPLGNTVLRLFLTTTLPVLLGLAVRQTLPVLARRLEPILGRVALVVFAAIVVYAALSAWALLSQQVLGLLAPVIVLNLLVMSMGWLLARVARLSPPRRTAVAMETGLQNAALAIFIAFSVLNEPALIGPAAVYSIWMNLAALGFAWWMSRRA